VTAKIEEGPLLRSFAKNGKAGKSLSDWAIWPVVEPTEKRIGIKRFEVYDLRHTYAKLCRKSGGDLEQIKFLPGSLSIQTTEWHLESEQEIAVALNLSRGF
jgi:site-specific recombinase XerD